MSDVKDPADLFTEPERKRMAALVAASWVWQQLEMIEKCRDQIRQNLEKYNPGIGDHAKRRDCESFEKRLRELLLWDKAHHEAHKDGLIKNEKTKDEKAKDEKAKDEKAKDEKTP
jgi:hypothetical protein